MTRTNDDVRRWIAENLLLGATAQTLHAAMLNEGFDAGEAAREINTALASPCLQGSARLRNRLRKRNWTLSVYGQLSRMRASGAAVERRERLTRDEFLEQYYFQNRPVIITGAFDSWPARTQWSFGYFRARCGDCEVEVQLGRESDPNYEINQPDLKRKMPFREYVDLVERSGPTNDFYMTANNTSINRASLAALWEDVPTVHEYLDPASPDTGFFWFGPGGTKTP